MTRTPRITTAGAPPKGRGFYSEVLADGRSVVALGSGSQTGFELDYELADVLLPALAAAAADGDAAPGYDAIAAHLGELRASLDIEHDERLPMLTAIVAVCSDVAAEVSWVGHDKAYLVRDRAIVGETVEHTHWRSGGRPEWTEMMAQFDPMRPPTDSQSELFRHMLGVAIRTITADGARSDRLGVVAAPGDALILVSASLHKRIGWRAGVERSLAQAAAVDAASILHEARAIAVELGTTHDYLAWTGPVVVVHW